MPKCALLKVLCIRRGRHVHFGVSMLPAREGGSEQAQMTLVGLAPQQLFENFAFADFRLQPSPDSSEICAHDTANSNPGGQGSKVLACALLACTGPVLPQHMFPPGNHLKPNPFASKLLCFVGLGVFN